MTTTATPAADVRTWPADPFDKALAAEPRLRAVDAMVRLLAARAPQRRSGKPMCHGCVWSNILKPLVKPLVGWERGIHRQAPEQPHPRVRVLTAADLDPTIRRRPAENATEEWLRSADAWDAVTTRWMNLLYDADPANGCGLPA